MAITFKWLGTYDDTTSDDGKTIAGNGLSAGSGDGGEDTTLYNANSDYMSITSLAVSGGVIQQSSTDVLNLNQGTLYLRLFFDDNTVNSQHVFGYYTASGALYFTMDYNSAGRFYLRVQDDEGTPNQFNIYRSWTPSNGVFYDVRITWDLDTNNSVGISIDGDSFSATSGGGSESNIVQSGIDPPTLYLGNRTATFSPYEGEVSEIWASDVFEDTTLGEVVATGMARPKIYGNLALRGLTSGGLIQ